MRERPGWGGKKLTLAGSPTHLELAKALAMERVAKNKRVKMRDVEPEVEEAAAWCSR